MCIHNNLIYLYLITFSDEKKLQNYLIKCRAQFMFNIFLGILACHCCWRKRVRTTLAWKLYYVRKNQLWRDFGFWDIRHRVLNESKFFGANEIVYQFWKG